MSSELDRRRCECNHRAHDHLSDSGRCNEGSKRCRCSIYRPIQADSPEHCLARNRFKKNWRCHEPVGHEGWHRYANSVWTDKDAWRPAS